MIKKKPTRKRVIKQSPEPPCCGGDIHKHHTLTKWLFGLAVISVLMVGIPAMLWAQTSHQPGERISVDAESLEHVQTKVNELQEAMRLLMASGQPMDWVPVETTYPDEARADCLNDCRFAQVACMNGFEGEVAEGELHPCLATANSCITTCNEAPRLPIACQDRCAVALAGCIQRIVAPSDIVIEDETAALNNCMMQNQGCLINACRLENASVLPENYCSDQCGRMKGICRTGSAQYNTNALDVCERMGTACMERVCGHEQPESSPPSRQIGLMSDATYGQFLVDEDGMALYYYAKDRPGVSACKGSCVANWPVFYRNTLRLGSGLEMDAFGTMMREDGQMQNTYNGWPLYTFIHDAPGDMMGQGINDQWFLMGKDVVMTLGACHNACDFGYEDCKRSEEAPYACQEQMAACNTDCDSYFSGAGR